MALQLRQPAICRVCCHQCADRPLINRTEVCISLEEVWGDKRFQYKPSTEIHPVMNGLCRNSSEGRDEKSKVRMDPSETALTRRACRLPTSTSCSEEASTSLAERCR